MRSWWGLLYHPWFSSDQSQMPLQDRNFNIEMVRSNLPKFPASIFQFYAVIDTTQLMFGRVQYN